MCTSLILANRSTCKPVTDAQFKNLLVEGTETRKYKSTLVIVNNSLVMQWKKEIEKFAPSLNVYTYYTTMKNREEATNNLRSADVVITTPHMVMPRSLLENVHWHRLIMDEAHLLSSGTTSSKLSALMRYQTDFIWLGAHHDQSTAPRSASPAHACCARFHSAVTGTPISSSIYQLSPQARLLGMYVDDNGASVQRMVEGAKRKDWVDPGPTMQYFGRRVGHKSVPATHPRDDMPNQDLVDLLKKYMIRHTKSMRIGGEEALSLPDGARGVAPSPAAPQPSM